MIDTITNLRASVAYTLIRIAFWIYPGVAAELAEIGWNAFAEVIEKDDDHD